MLREKRDMTEVLLFIGTASLLIFGAATLFVATLALRTARRYVELAEERMERLRKGQARLLGLPTDEQQELSEELERERRARRDAERRVEGMERELRKLLEARNAGPLPAVAGSNKDSRGAYGLTKEAPPNRNTRGAEKNPPTGFLETSTRKPSDGPPRNEKPRLAVKHPHPDDAVAGPSSRQARTPSAAPVEMFRKHYDKYLENYRGYVELAEHLHRTRDEGGMKSGSFEEDHWEERLRRVNDGIARTIARLDILEGQNPGLAADDLISLRARVARMHAELGRRGETTGGA